MEKQMLEGKAAIVTGASYGMGQTIAELFAEEGASVVLTARGQEKLDAVVEGIRAKGQNAVGIVADVCSTEDTKKVFETAVKEFGHLDILVNNAGINIKKDYFDFTAEEFDKIMETQAKAPFMLSQTAAKYMKERKSGCILFISSLASILGMHEIQAYTVAKSGVKGLARSLARDLGPYGIRVNSLNPGFVYTDMLKNTNLKTPGRLEEIQNRTPMRGFAREKDLGMAAAFLASDAARFITGIDLVVDGGISSSFLI